MRQQNPWEKQKTFNRALWCVVQQSGNTVDCAKFLLFVALSIDISLSFKLWVNQVAIQLFTEQVHTPLPGQNKKSRKINNFFFEVSDKSQPLRDTMPSIINSNLWVF